MSQKLKNVQQNLPQRSNQKKLKKIGTVSNGSTVSYTDKHRLNRPAYALSMQTRYGKYNAAFIGSNPNAVSFICGWEYVSGDRANTEKILDIVKAKGVKKSWIFLFIQWDSFFEYFRVN